MEPMRAGVPAGAGRIVSVVFGTLLAFPVYLIGGRLFGQRVALAAAALTAFHPSLIIFSVSVFGELTFLPLLMVAVYSAMYAATNPTRLALAASGALYGASCLIRPEAFIYMLVGLGCSGSNNQRATARWESAKRQRHWHIFAAVGDAILKLGTAKGSSAASWG
jgi:4-amino-4-deoxy-L-arabinose transferase-like glycosyltransferase